MGAVKDLGGIGFDVSEKKLSLQLSLVAGPIYVLGKQQRSVLTHSPERAIVSGATPPYLPHRPRALARQPNAKQGHSEGWGMASTF